MGSAALLIDDLAQSGSIVASSQELEMPASNLLTPNPSERWRSTSAPAWFVLDLLSAQAIDTVLIKGFTGGSSSEIQIRLSSSDPTGAAGEIADTGVILDGTQYLDLDYETVCYLWGTPLTCRYIRVDISDPGASYVEAGIIVAGEREAFTYNFSSGNITWIDRSRLDHTSGGQTVIWNDNTFRRVELSLDWVAENQSYGLFDRMHRVNGAHKNVLLILNTDSDNLARDSILGLITPPAMSYLNAADEFGNLFGTQLRLEERL